MYTLINVTRPKLNKYFLFRFYPIPKSEKSTIRVASRPSKREAVGAGAASTRPWTFSTCSSGAGIPLDAAVDVPAVPGGPRTWFISLGKNVKTNTFILSYSARRVWNHVYNFIICTVLSFFYS